MKIIDVKSLQFPDVKVIQYTRFPDKRGYFAEIFRRSDLDNNPNLSFFKKLEFTQHNESYSKKNVIKGLHFQWNPFMGKLVRTITGYMIDLFLDIRINSPTYGKIGAYRMPTDKNIDIAEWIWIPVGFAHGNIFLQDTIIEYLCTGQYSPHCEIGIHPFASDIDWSLADPDIKKLFETLKTKGAIMSEKDQKNITLKQWSENENRQKFNYS